MSRSTQALAVAAVMLGLAGAALAVTLTHGTTPATFRPAGPGMMGGYRGMMGGGTAPSTSASVPSAGALGEVRDRVQQWLASTGLRSFRVSEVMAFTRNDYVAVRDGSGRPAFELLVAPTSGWFMEEPPSMMWNIRYGMMRGGGYGMMGGSGYGGMMSGNWNGGDRSGIGGNATGSGPAPSLAQAVAYANRWLAQARPGERVAPDVGGMGAFPGYYTLDTTRSGATTGMLSVNAATGAIWYHTWHGHFLAERDF